MKNEKAKKRTQKKGGKRKERKDRNLRGRLQTPAAGTRARARRGPLQDTSRERADDKKTKKITWDPLDDSS